MWKSHNLNTLHLNVYRIQMFILTKKAHDKHTVNYLEFYLVYR